MELWLIIYINSNKTTTTTKICTRKRGGNSGTVVLLIKNVHIINKNTLKKRQPGRGGIRFVALNGVSWALYAITIIFTATNMFLGDVVLSMASFGVGFLSYGFMCVALLTYQNEYKKTHKQLVNPVSVFFFFF